MQTAAARLGFCALTVCSLLMFEGVAGTILKEEDDGTVYKTTTSRKLRQEYKTTCSPCNKLCAVGSTCVCGDCVPNAPTCPPCIFLCVVGKTCVCGRCVPTCPPCTKLCADGFTCKCGNCVPSCQPCTKFCMNGYTCVCNECVPKSDACVLQCDSRGPSVCGVDGKTYDNACVAKCQGVTVAYEGSCLPGCNKCPSDVTQPVCVVTKTGSLTALNCCYGQCAAGSSSVLYQYPGSCQPACDAQCSPQPLDPVCGADGQTYPNACYADCVTGTASNYTNGACSAVNGFHCPVPILVFCLVNPCGTATCPADPTAQCVPSYCGAHYYRCNLIQPCGAYFLNPAGDVVNCDAKNCVPVGQQCRLDSNNCCNNGVCWAGPVVRQDQVYGMCYAKGAPLPRGLLTP